MNDEPKKKLPKIWPDRMLHSAQEKLLESPEGKLERLKDLTGIENEEELVDIYTELIDIIKEIEVANISYQMNDVDSRGGKERQFVFKNLNGEELGILESVLKKLRIFGFPETVSESNHTDLFIENKRDLEVLRLITVSNFIRKEIERLEYEKRMDAIRERNLAEQKRRREHDAMVIERALDDLRSQAFARAKRFDEEQKNAARLRMEQILKSKSHQEDVKREERVEKEKLEIEKEQKQKLRDERFAEIIKELEKIEPQEINITDEALDFENDNFAKVSGYRGYLPNSFPKNDRKIKEDKTGKIIEELDPLELEEEVKRMEEKWNSGEIVEEMKDEVNQSRLLSPSMKVFPDKYIWIRDKVKEGSKKKGKNRQYEYDPLTKKVGKEITKEGREEVFQELKRLRAERFAGDEKLKLSLKNGLPKSRKEKELETKFILLTKNLIAWLIRDLIGNTVRGNSRLKKMDIDDIFQNGLMGMMYAVDHADEEKKKSDTSIAYILACAEGYIRRIANRYRNELLEENENNGGINFSEHQVRVPEHTLAERRKINKIIRLLTLEFPGQKVTDEMVAVALSKPGIGILKRFKDSEGGLEQKDLSTEVLNALVGEYQKLRETYLMDYSEEAYQILESEEIDVDTRVDMLGNLLHTKVEDTEKEIENKKLEQAVINALLTLTPREERVLRLRFGIGAIGKRKEFGERGGSMNVRRIWHEAGQNQTLDGLTLDETGEKLNVTRERIRQIEAKALRKLKHPSRSRLLHGFLPDTHINWNKN